MAQLGSIEIPVEVTDDELQKELDKSKRKIERYDKETEKLTNKKMKLEVETAKTEADLKKLGTSFEDVNNKIQDLERTNLKGYLLSGQSPESQGYNKLLSQLDLLSAKQIEYETKLGNVQEEQEQITQKIKETKQARQGELQNLNEIVAKVDEYKNKSNGIDLSNLNNTLDQHEKKVGKIVKKVGKWALAVFGVRSAYQFVRQAASTIAQYDEKIGADIEYIRFALAYTLKPVVEWLIKAVYKILNLIGAIIYKITGKNIFKNSGAGAYEKAMKKSAKSTGKMAKDSKKIKDNFSAGFDEFTALQEKEANSKSGGSGGSGGSDFTAPTMSLGEGIENMELPKWAEKIVEIGKWMVANKDTVAKVVGVIISLLAFNKAITWIDKVGSFFGLFKSGTVPGNIEKSTKTLKDFFMTNNKLFTGGSGVAVGVLASLPIIIATVENAKEKLKETYDYQKKISEQGAKYSKDFVKNTDDVVELTNDLNYRQKMTKENLAKVEKLSESIFSGAYKTAGATQSWVQNTNDTLRNSDDILTKEMELYKQGKLNDEQKKQLIKQLQEQRLLTKDVRQTYKEIGVENKDLNGYVEKYEKFLRDAGADLEDQDTWWGKVFGKSKKVKEESQKWDTAVGSVKKGIDIINNMKLKDKKFNIEADTSKANKTLGGLLKNFGEKASEIFKASGLKDVASNIWKKISGIKLASGGIVNMPGKGVPVGAVAGEAGAEAVIPLNDETMDRLGSAIARHMSVNITNVNEMNGRVISRELKKVMNENDFTYNR